MASDIKSFINHLGKDSAHSKCLVHAHYIQAKKGTYSDFPEGISELLLNNLHFQGLKQLYSHQTEAINLIRKNKNVCVVTPTASGKTLIYNIPVIDSIIKDPDTRALYLYPIKALAQDQFHTVMEFEKNIFGENFPLASIYDGDTSAYQRAKIKRVGPKIILTNPDMLHFGILPYHNGWKEFYKNLKYVVIDEVHSYRGVFGSHVAHIIRRLRRICRHYGSNPVFICSSATISNAHEFITSLTGLDFEMVDQNGAPSSSKYFLLWNPLESPYTEAAHLLRECVGNEMKTIVFTKARKVTELIYQWISALGLKYTSKIAAYRSGYLPEERREIERKLFSEELVGVISTSALEVGIDIGGLDVCILVGYPGSIMSTWQRSGRVGRIGNALVILIGLQDALDQYFMTNPVKLFEKPCESAVVDFHNPVISKSHLACAASELPLDAGTDKGIYGAALPFFLNEMTKDNKLQKSNDGKYHSFERHPSRFLSIRSIGDSFTVVDIAKNRIIGEVDYPRVLRECHQNAVYLHSGSQYEVVELDLTAKKVKVREADIDYFTETRATEEIDVIDIFKQKQLGEITIKLGRVRVTEKVVGYVRKKIYSQAIFDEHKLNLPSHIFETVSIWLEIPDALKGKIITCDIGDFAGGIHAIEHAVISMLPLLTLSDRQDIGGVSLEFNGNLKCPAIFIYDAHPGGVGLSEKAYELAPELMKTTLEMLNSCPCDFGCPSCIQSSKCGSGNKPLDKNVAITLLNSFIKSTDMLDCLEVVHKDKTDLLKLVEAGRDEQDVKQKLAGRNVLVFDAETQRSAAEVGGWNNTHLMGLAVGVVYSFRDDKYYAFTEDKVKDMINMFLQADLVVGFNIKRFDWGVLKGYTNIDFTKIPTLDMLDLVYDQMGFRLSLNHLSSVNLNKGKSSDGLQSLQWFKEGKIDLIIEYCKHDVEITKELFEYLIEKGHFLYKTKDERVLQIPIDLSVLDRILTN
ncbi:MAG: DEAD/DEAH box helicase [Candidatus Firestonebacteria bacterium]